MSIHAQGTPQPVSHRTGALITMITALASATAVTLAVMGSIDLSGGGSAAAPSSNAPAGVLGGRAVPVGTRLGVRAAPSQHVSGASATRIGVRGVPLPAPGASATRIGVRGVPLPAPGASATRIGVRGVPLPATRTGVRGVPLPAKAAAPARTPATGGTVGGGFTTRHPGAP